MGGRIKKLFGDLDADSSGSVTITELEESMGTQCVQAVFASMDIDAKDAWTLFRMLGQKDEITAEDFVEGLMRLKGNAKRADFVELLMLVKGLDSGFQDLWLLVDDVSRRITEGSVAA